MSNRMSMEVAQIAPYISKAVGCTSCGVGIAIDAVGKRWKEPPYDWAGARFGHSCKVSKDGLSPEQLEKVNQIVEGLSNSAHTTPIEKGEMTAAVPDSRLPPKED